MQPADLGHGLDVDLDDFTAFQGGSMSAFSSPALTSARDVSTVSSSASSMNTVSPMDLFAQDALLSAPNSSAFTALTSPSIDESPDLTDAHDVSPNFGGTDWDGLGDSWYSLFPPDASGAELMQAEVSPPSIPDEVEAKAVVGRRGDLTPPSTARRHSSVAGVNSRRRDKPLPPIIVEDASDVVAVKRARNTLAARKSRERKAQRFEELEERIAKLEAERDYWKQMAMSQTAGA